MSETSPPRQFRAYISRQFIKAAYRTLGPRSQKKSFEASDPTFGIFMEVVSGIASLSQLAVYLDCTVTRLSHLYRTLSTATFLAKSQLEEVHVLLKILERIKKNHSPSDTEVLVPVLISIAKIVQTLENWFGPSSTIRLQWNLIVHKADIEEALRLLRQKYNLLAFYYSERNNCALNRIESCLNAHHHAALGSSVNMSSSVSICLLHIANNSSFTFKISLRKRKASGLSPKWIEPKVARGHTAENLVC